MKRLLGVMGSLFGVLALVTLTICFATILERLQRHTEPAPQMFQSPFRSPIRTPTPQPTPRRTSTRPPEPPTRTPTPTPESLPTLIPGFQTILYATTGERGPELYRVQMDQAARVTGPLYRVDTPTLWHSRIHLDGLYPSPDGRQTAVAWTYGEGGTFVSLLGVNDGAFVPLFGERVELDQRVEFLDWSPDGSSVLVLGRDTNPDLRGSAWLVDINTRQFRAMNIKQMTDAQQITGASFSGSVPGQLR